MYSENGAKIAFEEKAKGWVVPGFHADLIVLDEDPFGTAPERIKDIRVATTIRKGTRVHG